MRNDAYRNLLLWLRMICFWAKRFIFCFLLMTSRIYIMASGTWTAWIHIYFGKNLSTYGQLNRNDQSIQASLNLIWNMKVKFRMNLKFKTQIHLIQFITSLIYLECLNARNASIWIACCCQAKACVRTLSMTMSSHNGRRYSKPWTPGLLGGADLIPAP